LHLESPLALKVGVLLDHLHDLSDMLRPPLGPDDLHLRAHADLPRGHASERSSFLQLLHTIFQRSHVTSPLKRPDLPGRSRTMGSAGTWQAVRCWPHTPSA